MISFYLATLFVFTLIKGSATASSKQLSSATNQCQITLDNYYFDLCPLLNEEHNSGRVDLVLYETPPTITTIVYNISFNGPLPKSDLIPDNEQCVSGTWACMTKRKYHPGRDPENADHGPQVIPIVIGAPQSDPGGGSSVGDREDFGIYAQLRESDEDQSPSLSIHLRGSNYVDEPQRVQIDFECAESDDDAPKLSKVWNGAHIFTWTTKHACARVHQTASLEDDAEDNIPAEDKKPDDPPEGVEDPELPANQDMQHPHVPPDKSGPSIVMALACSSAVLLGVGYLVVRPPALLRKRVRAIRRARFLRGIGETKLLNWAAEEIEMLGDEEDEVDEMVNSRALPDEEIPLRPSPTHPNFIDYGTAR